MAYEEVQKAAARCHELSLTDREKMCLTGITDVSGFNESVVVLTTSQGDLTVRGEQLHIERIDLDAGELELRGHVQELSYDEPRQSGSLWSRLFG